MPIKILPRSIPPINKTLLKHPYIKKKKKRNKTKTYPNTPKPKKTILPLIKTPTKKNNPTKN